MASMRRPYLHSKCQHGRCPTLKRRYIFLAFVSSVAFLLWSPHLLRGSLKEFVYNLKGDFSTLFTCKEDDPPPRSFKVRVASQDPGPPLIWSFPGSGDTWIRLLLEMASGIHTGSVYNDRDLMAALPGEIACNSSVLAVKAHPNSIPLDLITRSFEPGGKFYDSEKGPLLDKWRDGEFFPERYPGTYEKNVLRTIENFSTKCRGLTFTRAIVIVRDPYRALWAEYQRFYGWLRCPKAAPCPAHSFTIDHTLFNATHFKEYMLGFAQSWLMQWHEYQRFREEIPDARVAFVRYEDLLSPTRRDSVLKRLIAFIDVPMAAPSAHCAFRWSRSTLMKRIYSNETINFMCAWMHDLLGKDVSRLAEEFGLEGAGETAYLDDIGGHDGEVAYPFSPEIRARSESSLVCKVWRVLGTEAKAAGYKPPFGLKCLTPKRNSLFKNLHVDMLRASR